LRQIAPSSAVCEEGSFTAPPSGKTRLNRASRNTSQRLNAPLAATIRTFDRQRDARTPAGLRYYKRCVEAVGTLEHAAEESAFARRRGDG